LQKEVDEVMSVNEGNTAVVAAYHAVIDKIDSGQ